MNDDSDFLMISGLKHFRFCRRRWALVHIEQLWEENALTEEGHFLHERVHDENFTEKRGSVLLSRAMPVRSERLRITGECDMVELRQSEDGVPIHGREGLWQLYPVEYKRGQPDSRGADEMQLCAQAMCLEEMFVTRIPEGAVYYGELRRRQEIPLTEELRAQTAEALSEMQRLYTRGSTPRAKYSSVCKSCSMIELCKPELSKRVSASEYIRRAWEEEKS